jgi:hypothetical protein
LQTNLQLVNIAPDLIDESCRLYDSRRSVIKSRHNEITWIRIITLDCYRYGACLV